MQKLNELIVKVLNEVQFCTALFLIHNENCQEAVWFFDTGVDHFYEDLVELAKWHHQLLSLLHFAEAVLSNQHFEMEKQIVLACQLYFDIFDLVLTVTALLGLEFG